MSLYYQKLVEFEKSLILETLKENKFNKLLTAKVLGISRGKLQTILQIYFPDEYIRVQTKKRTKLKTQINRRKYA